jgi:hypothetical protein
MGGAPGRFAGRLDLGQRKPGVIEKGSASRRQLDAPNAANEKLSPDFSLQIVQLPTERRLRGVQPPLRGKRDAALLGDGNEVAQMT